MAKAPVLSQEFRDFLIEAKTHGYGTESVDKLTLYSGSTEIAYEDGDWLYMDSYAGGDPFTGYEHVSVRHPQDSGTWVPVWGMNYFGQIKNNRISGQRLAQLLGEVLVKPEPAMPIRGPQMHFFKNGGGRYELRNTRGTLESFTAFEVIGRNMQDQLYRAEFMGGLINRNPELEALNPRWLAP
jgi:hypothetical protein